MSDDTSTSDDTLRSLLNPRNMALRHKLGIVGLLGLAVLPTVLSPINAFVMVSAFYFAIFTMSWDVVSGYTGQISFGHGVFFAVGGYTSALLNMGHGLDPVLSIPSASSSRPSPASSSASPRSDCGDRTCRW
jgi:branched-chain amino acid transport system permease protein